MILHGGDDQLVPVANFALRAVKLVKPATQKIYEGASHGVCTTLKDRVNADLLASLRE
jgi:non-heme chloroperoxidase